MRLPPMMRRLNSWPAILPVGIVSRAMVAVETAGGAAVWARAWVGRARPNGTAAEAIREDFTKPRREICCAMRRPIAVLPTNVKAGIQDWTPKDRCRAEIAKYAQGIPKGCTTDVQRLYKGCTREQHARNTGATPEQHARATLAPRSVPGHGGVA